MTGSGSCGVDGEQGRVACEVRSVNHRFLKTTVHVGGVLSALEPEIEDRVRARVERGHVTLSLRWVRSARAAAGALRLDLDVAQAAAEALRAAARACGLPPEAVTLREVLDAPGVWAESGGETLPDEVAEGARHAIDGALAALVEARRREGAHLAGVCRELLDRIAATRAQIAARAPTLPGLYRDRLAARIATLLRGPGLEGSGVAPDPAALAREVAGYADRCDVAEELARLDAHLAHLRETLAAGGAGAKGGAMGRRLDFLVQELHRETNTLGSKSPDAELTALVVEMKADVERLREQVQNFE